jgi:hypothetical protein
MSLRTNKDRRLKFEIKIIIIYIPSAKGIMRCEILPSNPANNSESLAKEVNFASCPRAFP